MKTEISQEVKSFHQALINSFQTAFDANTIKGLESGIASFHLYKATRLLKAIVILGEKAHCSEGYILLRTLLNLCINLKWMFEKSIPYRTKRFADFDVVFKQKGIDTSLQFGGFAETEKNELIEISRENKKKIKDLKNQYVLPPEYDLNSWSGKSISDMASETGIGWYYNLVYTTLSNHEHTNPNSVQEYFEGVHDGKWSLKEKDHDEEELELLIKALAIYLLAVEIYNGQVENKVVYDAEKFNRLEKSILIGNEAPIAE